MKKLKNIITINDFNYSQGGASKVAIDTANMLAKEGFNSVFISAVTDDTKCTLDNKVLQYKFNGQEFLHYKNKFNGMLDGIKCKNFSKFINLILDDYDPQDTVIHVHGWTKACSSDFFNVLRRKQFKTFITLHEYFTFCPNGAYFNYKTNKACNEKGCGFKCLISNCDSRNYIFKLYRYLREIKYKKDINFNCFHAIYVSEFEKNVIQKQFITPYHSIIENPIDSSFKVSERKEYDYVYVGRTSKEKGIDLFISLARSLPKKAFLIVGDYKTDLKNVKVTGWVTEQKVSEYIGLANFLVFPSLWPETFGLNVIKALRAGIPCIVSSNTACEDYVVNGKNGFVFKQGNEAELLKCASSKLTPDEVVADASNTYISKLISLFEEGFHE